METNGQPDSAEVSIWKRIPKWAYIVAAVLLLAGIGSLLPNNSQTEPSSSAATDERNCPTAPVEMSKALKELVAAYEGKSIAGRVIAVDYGSAGYGDGSMPWKSLVLAKVRPDNKWGVWAYAKANVIAGSRDYTAFFVVNDVAGEITTDIGAPQSKLDMIQMSDALASIQGRKLWACRK